uniref:L1 transposable element RRM domain-containing protein n=1 Tax=Latimeria chalumnae TaxID=7897 RepID=H2ZSF3_LATCH
LIFNNDCAASSSRPPRTPSPFLSNVVADSISERPEIPEPSGDITVGIKMILTSLQQISVAISDIKLCNKDILGRLTSMETHLTESDERLSAAEARIVMLTSTVADLRDKIDQENRVCRNNIRILGFPEGVEQGNPSKFLEEALPTLLKLPTGTDLSIERAHRSLAPRPGPGQRPCPFIIKLLRFPVKELLLRSARDLGTLEWEGHKILLFPDLSRALQDRRRQFLSVKRILRDKMIKYGLFYPATLRVTYKGTTSSFATAEEAEKFVKTL